MDSARDEDGRTVTIEMVRGLATVPELWCAGELPDGTECGQPVWTTSLDSRLRAAAFAAHHRPGCDESSESSISRPGDAGHNHPVGSRPTRWRMRFDGAAPSAGLDGRQQPDERAGGRRTRRYEVDADLGETDTSTERSFSTLLTNLIHEMVPPRLELQLGSMDPVMASDIIVHAWGAEASIYNGRNIILWGKVASIRATRYSGYMLRLEDAADNIAVLLDEDQMSRLRIQTAEVLEGRHVIAYGRYVVPQAQPLLPYLRVMQNAVAFNPRVYRPRAL